MNKKEIQKDIIKKLNYLTIIVNIIMIIVHQLYQIKNLINLSTIFYCLKENIIF